MELDLAAQHRQALADGDVYKYGTALQKTGKFFGDMENATRNGSGKILQISKTFGAAQALINAYIAGSQVLASPSATWLEKIPAALSIIGAGLGFVNSIKGISAGSGASTPSVSGSSGGRSSGGGSSRPTSTVEKPKAPLPQRVYVQGLDPKALFTGEMVSHIFEQFYTENDNRGKVFIVKQ